MHEKQNHFLSVLRMDNPAILLEKYSATLLSETEEITELEQGD